MSKHKLIVFSTDNEFALMLQLYFESRDFFVSANILNKKWTETDIIESCKVEEPDAIVMWEYGSQKMIELFNQLKDDKETQNITVALIMMAWPGWLEKIPDYVFVQPFQIDKVESYIVTGYRA